MNTSAAQLQFAAEFVSFLASAAGLALVALRGELASRVRNGRIALGAGFVLLGAAAFLHGAALIEKFSDPWLVGLRAAGVVLALAGAVSWRDRRFSRWALVAGAVMVAAGAFTGAAGGEDAGAVLIAAGGLAFGAAVVVASRRSIAARVAASAAAALLLFVLVLAVVLSTVVVRTVEHDELRRLERRASSEATAAERTSVLPQLRDAKVVAASLAADRSAELSNGTATSVASLSDALKTLSDRFFQGTQLLLVGGAQDAPRVLAAANLDNATALAIAGSDAVVESIRRGDSIGTVQLAGDRPVSLGTVPVRVITPEGQAATRAVVVAVQPLDGTYLEQRTADDPTLSLELVTRRGVVSAGRRGQPPAGAIRTATTAAFDGTTSNLRVKGRFAVVEPVHDAAGKVVLALVASTPQTVVDSSRNSLSKTLFLIALGGTLLALMLAVVVGERIGARLRRLTTTAESISQGDLSVRAAIDADDEVGVLGRTFDAMAGSIEEKTAAESRLRNRLEAVVGGMGEALVAVDGDGAITDFNQAAEELTGILAADARGRTADTVVRLVGEDGTDLAHRLARPTPTRWAATATVHDEEDRRIPVAVIGGPLRGPANELAGAVFVLRDLRREREVEQMKTEFLSRVGHELRTPLTGIMGYADLLTRREVPPERARAWHAEILKQSKALFRIVQMLEFFASSGAGRIPLRTEPLQIRGLVDELLERWEERIDGTHPLSRRIGRGLPAVQADRRWVALSLDELVDNAVKFSPGGGKIDVTARPYDDDNGGGVELSVIDHGNGMSDDEVARAFTDFAQGDTSDTRSFGGLGLGLSLVQRVAEAHGGAVAVESRVGRGSKVSIRLPAMPKEPV